MRNYKVGDTDDTPDYLGEPFCLAVEPLVGYECTRNADHEGNHAAGTGHHIASVWV